MSTISNIPVIDLLGVGSVKAQALESVAIFTTFDLLRAEAATIQSAITPAATLAEVRSWRQMATMLQVHDVTPALAKALVEGGVKSMADLSRRSLDAFLALVDAARGAGQTIDPISANQAADMLRDAAILERSGALSGTVIDAAGNPLQGAVATIADVQATSDARGRFRLVRIPLTRATELRIEHPQFKAYRANVLRTPHVALVHAWSFTLRVRPATTSASASTTPAPSRALHEIDGDPLPPMSGQPVVETEIQLGDLRDGDLLRLIHLYAGGRDAKLVCKLLSYEDAKFVVRWLRVPLAKLPASPLLREHYTFRAGAFTRIKMTAAKSHAYRKLRRLKQRFAGRAAPQTNNEVDQAIRERIAEMKRMGLLRGRRTRNSD